MIPSARQSILSRPVRPAAAQRNAENVDTEHERSQQRQQGLQLKREEQNDYRRRAFVGTAEERRQLQEEHRRQIAAHLDVKNQSKSLEHQHDRAVVQVFAQHEQYCAEQERATAEEKRQRQRAVMEENARLAEERRVREKAQRAAEIERERGEVPYFERVPRSFC